MQPAQATLLLFALFLSNATPYKVIVIGDIHGDFDQFLAMLIQNEVLDTHHNWILENGSKVVQMGDMIDRGYDDKKVLEWIRQTQAAHPNEWIQLLGNHELMNLRGSFGFAVDGLHGIGFGNTSARKTAIHSGKIGRWLKSLPTMHMEGDILFVHANVDLQAVGNRHWTTINQEMSDAIRFCPDHRRCKLSRLERGLLWSRKLVSRAALDDCSAVAEVLRRFNATRLVLGHTIDRDLPRHCDDRVFQADVGMSRYYKQGDGHRRNVVFDINSTTGAAFGFAIVRTPTVLEPFGPEKTVFQSFKPDAYSVLGLSVDDNPSTGDVRRAYRRLRVRSPEQTEAYSLLKHSRLQRAYKKWLKKRRRARQIERGGQRGVLTGREKTRHTLADNDTHTDL